MISLFKNQNKIKKKIHMKSSKTSKMELFELNQHSSNLRDENESIDSTQKNKKLSLKQLNFMRNAWKNLDQRKQKKFKRVVNQKLNTDQEIKDFDYFVDYLDGSQDEIPYKN